MSVIRKFTRKSRLFLAVASALWAHTAAVQSVFAQTARTWTGLGANNNWTTAGNWSGGVAPIANDTLIFSATGVGVRPAPVNNFPANTNFGRIVVSSGGYTISGVAVSSTGGVLASPATGSSTLALILAGAGSVQKSGAGTLVLTGANSFTGGVRILAGTVSATTSASALGAASGVLTIGNTSGSDDATFNVGVGAIANPVVIAGGSTGNTLRITNTLGATLSGAITINHDLVLSTTATNALTLTGGIAGTGNLTTTSTGTTASITLSTNPVNMVGTITNAGTHTGTTTISGGIGANVSAVVQASNSAPLTVSTQPIVVGAGGKSITSTSTGALLSITGGTSGSGNVLITHNGSLATGISFATGAINHAGSITNAGTGTGATLVASPLGANVTGVVQNSASSALSLSGVNTAFAGPTTLSAGNLRLGSATALGGAGTTTGTGGTLTIAAGTTLTSSANVVLTTRNAQIWQGDFVLGGTFALTFGPGAVNITSPNLVISSNTGTTNAVLVPGAIGGTTNLAITQRGTVGLTFSGNLATSGTLTTTGTGTGVTTFSGGVAASVTSIAHTSNTSALTIATLPLVVGASGTTLSSTSTGQTLSITGGITGTGPLTLNNNGPRANGITVSTGTVNHTGLISNTGSGGGAALLSAPIGTNVTGVTQNSASSALTLSGANPLYRGVTTLAAGNLRLGSATALGGNGSTTGTGGAFIIGAGTTLDAIVPISLTTSNATTLQGDFTFGGASVLNTGTAAITIAAPTITISSNTGTTALATFRGVVNGTSNVTVNQRGTSGITFQANLNTTGTVTNTGTGTGTTTLAGGVSATVSTITQASNSAPLVASAAVVIGAAGKTLSSTSSGAAFTLSGGTTGTGTLTITNNGTMLNGIVVSAGVSHTGAIINAGTGTGSTLLSSVVPASVTGITQNSASSALTVSGANIAYRGTTTLSAGNLRLGSATALGGNGTATGTGGALLIAAGTTLDAVSAVALTTRNAHTWQGSFTLGGAFALNTGPSPITVAGPSLQLSTNTGTSALVTLPGTVTGTSNLTTNVLGSSAFDFSGPLNLSGSITNTGSGAGVTTLSGPLAASVVAVEQNSLTSALVLSGANTNYAGTTRITLGALRLGSPTALGGAGSTTGVGGPLLIANGATIDAISPLVLSTVNPMTWSGNVNFGGTADLTMSTAAVTVSAPTTQVSSDPAATGRWTIPGTVSGTTDLTLALNGSAAVTFAGALNVNGAITNASTSTGSTLITGTVSPAVTTITQASGTSPMSVSAPLTVAVAGLTLRNTATGGSAVLSLTGGIAGTGNVGLRNNGPVTQGITIAGPTLSFAGTLTNSGTGTGDVLVSAALSSSLTAVTQQGTPSPLTLTGANVTYAGEVTVQSGTLRVSNSSALGDGGNSNRIVMNGGTLQALGAIASPSSRPWVLNGSAAIDANGFNVLIDGAVGGAGGLTTLGAGSLQLTGAVSLGGDFTIASGTVVAPTTSTFAVAGQWSNSGTFTHNGGTVTFNGSSAQSIGGATPTTFGALTVNNPAGLTIATSPTIDRVLTFVSGKIVTGANRVIIGSAGTVSSASANAYVFGTLERYVANGTAPTIKYDIGDATVYAPVTVHFNGTTSGSGSLAVSTTAGDHPDLAASGANPAQSLNRFWTLLNGGVSGFTDYAATFEFVPSDLDAGANALQLIVRQRNAGVWSIPAFDNRLATSIRATGLTAFGDFAMAQQLVGAASASTSTLVPATSRIPANGVSTQTLTLITRDAAGLPLSVGGALVTITRIGGIGTIGPVTDVGNGSYTALVTSASQIGSGTFYATLNGSDVQGGTGQQARVTVTYGADAATGARSTLTPVAASMVANGRSTQLLTVITFDAQGNRIEHGGAPVLFSLVAGTGTIGETRDVGDGTYTATVTAPSRVGRGEFIARIDGDTVRSGTGTTTRAVIDYTVGAVSGAGSTLTPTTASLLADGLDVQRLTVTARDSTGNPLDVGGATVTVSRLAGTGVLSAVVDKGDGTYEATVTAPAQVGNGVFVATINGAPVRGGGTTATQATVQYVQGVARRFVVRVNPVQNASADSAVLEAGITSQVTAQLASANGDPVAQAGVAVTWRSTSANGAFSSLTSVTNAAGVAQVNYTADTVAGVGATVAATDSAGRTGSAAIRTRAGAALAARSIIVVPPTGLLTTPSTISVQLRDRYGNAAEVSPGALRLDVRGANADADRSAVATAGPATYTLTYTPTRAGTDTIRVLLLGDAFGASAVSVVGTPAPALELSISTSKADPAVGDTVTIVMTLTNPGTGPATMVQVASQIPIERFTRLSLTVSLGTFVEATQMWEVGTLPAGATVTLTFKGVVRLPPG